MTIQVRGIDAARLGARNLTSAEFYFASFCVFDFLSYARDTEIEGVFSAVTYPRELI